MFEHLSATVCGIALLALAQRSGGTEIDNGILDEPLIECGDYSATLLFSTHRPFQGRVFVKGHSAEEQCVHDYTEVLLDDAGRENNSLTVNYDHCGVARQRSANPIGVAVETTIVIQFHPIVDRAVSAELEVSMLTTSFISAEHPLPTCTYSIRNGDFDGPEVSFVRVGDPVYHRWECKMAQPDEGEPPEYGMLVHSCYVENGQGQRVLLVDEMGCAIDPYVLGHLTYSTDLVRAYREAHVFKFADRNVLLFACQVRLCYRAMGTCTGVTPPNCLPLKNKRSLNVTPSSPAAVSQQYDSTMPTFDLSARRILVFDNDEVPGLSSHHKESRGVLSAVLREDGEGEGEEEGEVIVCFSNTGSVAMLAIMVFGAIGVILCCMILIARHQRSLIFADKLFQSNTIFR